MTWFDDRKTTCPIVAGNDQIGDLPAGIALGFGIGVRSKMTPQDGGSDDHLANSPKSLSKVIRIGYSCPARSRTWRSGIPGATVLTQMTSWSAANSASTAAPGKFSSARNRISGCARGYSLRAQGVARRGEACEDIVMLNAGIILQDVGLVPTIRHEADHKLDGQPRAADDRLSGENLGGKRDTIVFCHGEPANSSTA